MSRANEGSSSTGHHQLRKGYSSSTDHESTLTIEKSYTSFKWKLNEFSLLEKCLTLKVSSPKFLITNTTEQCEIILQKNDQLIKLTVASYGNIYCQRLRISFAIIDEYDTKIKEFNSFVRPLGNGTWHAIEHNVMEIATNEIFSNEKYLVNDTLTFLCEIHANIIKVSEEHVHSVNLAHFDKSSCQKFEEYYSNKVFSDIDFFVKEKKFRAHKIILAMASPVFEAMFRADMLEAEKNSVRITDINADVFEKFLKFLYVGKVENFDEIAVDLLIVAGKYQVSDLMNLCENFLIKTINISNAIECLLVAHQHSFKKLKGVALRLVRSNIHNLTEENDFKELCDCSDLLGEILRRSE